MTHPFTLFATAGRWVARRVLEAMDQRRKRIDDRTPFGTDADEA